MKTRGCKYENVCGGHTNDSYTCRSNNPEELVYCGIYRAFKAGKITRYVPPEKQAIE